MIKDVGICVFFTPRKTFGYGNKIWEKFSFNFSIGKNTIDFSPLLSLSLLILYPKPLYHFAYSSIESSFIQISRWLLFYFIRHFVVFSFFSYYFYFLCNCHSLVSYLPYLSVHSFPSFIPSLSFLLFPKIYACSFNLFWAFFFFNRMIVDNFLSSLYLIN